MTGGTIARRTAPARMAYWQALDSGRILLMAAAAMLVMAAFAGLVALHPNVNWPTALAFGGFIAFGELFRLEGHRSTVHPDLWTALRSGQASTSKGRWGPGWTKGERL